MKPVYFPTEDEFDEEETELEEQLEETEDYDDDDLSDYEAEWQQCIS